MIHADAALRSRLEVHMSNMMSKELNALGRAALMALQAKSHYTLVINDINSTLQDSSIRPSEAMMNILFELQNAGDEISQALHAVISATASAMEQFDKRLNEVEQANIALQKANAVHVKQEQLQQFLARYRDHIGRFREYISGEAGFASWQKLAYALQDEEDALDYLQHTNDIEQLAGITTDSTNKLKAVLARHGMTMQDWADVRAVADQAISRFHQGRKEPIRVALSGLKQSTVPAELVDKQPALIKALEILQGKARAWKH